MGYFVAGLVSDEADPDVFLSVGSTRCGERQPGPVQRTALCLASRSASWPSGKRVGARAETSKRPGRACLVTAALSPIGDDVSDVRTRVRSSRPASRSLPPNSARHSTTSDLAQHERINAVPRASTRTKLRI